MNLRDVLGLSDEGWQDQALCAEVDPDIFHPEKGGSPKQAKSVCATCEVRIPCLEYALTTEEAFGVWGGLTEGERRRVLRQTRETGAPVQRPCALTDCTDNVPLGARDAQLYCTTRHSRLAAERRGNARKNGDAA